MKKILSFLFVSVLSCSMISSCDSPKLENTDEGTDPSTPSGVVAEFPFIDEFPIECGNMLIEGTEVGVTIEVKKVEEQNFVFELRPGPMVQSFVMNVYPVSQLYNSLLNDKNSGLLPEVCETWDINQRIREYLFTVGDSGYAFSASDDRFEDEDFLQVEFDWMSTAYAANSAIVIPDCGYIIAVVGSVEDKISDANQEQLTLCYVHTPHKPLVGDPQCEIIVSTGYTAFAVNHELNADAAGVYYFGWLQNEIDEYIDTFGDTLFRDFVRTMVSAPSVPNDVNNPNSLHYRVDYGEAPAVNVMSTTVAVAVDANLTPQEGYSRKDFQLLDEPEGLPEADVTIDVVEERVAANYFEFDVNFTKECQTIFYKIYPSSFAETISAMSDKDKRDLARYVKQNGYLYHNPEFLWDAKEQVAVGSDAVVRLVGLRYANVYPQNDVDLPLEDGKEYVMVYVGRNGAQKLTDVMVTEPFSTDKRNLESPDACKAKDLTLVLDNPDRTEFKATVTYDASTVSMVYIQYMTEDNNPGMDENTPWRDWVDFVLDAVRTDSRNIMVWPTLSSGNDWLVWTGMDPDTEYTVFMCAEDFDGNVSPMFFQKIKTDAVQIGPDPTINMSLVPASKNPYDWTVHFDIDHDVEYFLYCTTKSASDLARHIPGINQGHMVDIANSGFTYEEWYNGIYDWVAAGFENDGGGMMTNSDTSLDWQGNEVVIAACIAVGHDGTKPVYKMYHLICKNGQAQTLEEIFGIE